MINFFTSASPQTRMILFSVADAESNNRLDRCLRARFPQWGRQAVQRAICAGHVRVNSKVVWLASWQVRAGDRIEVSEPPEEKPAAPEIFDPAWLIADDGVIFAVNKPDGLLAEPTRWGAGVNLRDLAAAWTGEPLILFHRLDRDTSGVILLTRPGPINAWLDTQFKRHTVRKEYVAVVAGAGALAAEGTIDLRLAPDPHRRERMVVVPRGGQPARTHYRLESLEGGRVVVRLWPETGRTHQLRVHLAAQGAPILGDRLYGDASSAPRLMLHALRITLPAGEGSPARTFEAPLPSSFTTTA